ncbi:MAG: penicillin amidase [Geminicoccaceae bacterium]|nr:MAG: penicillin amidase [Geminicoccaceae bacterium]
MLRFLRRAVLALAALVAAALVGIAGLLVASLPEHEGRVAVAGLDGPVEILRDAHAVPAIRATSERDAWFALGFVHGTDRLWQLEVTRRIGRGRLAELLGARALPFDRFMRTLGLARVAEEGLAAYRPEERALLEAYAAGVNAAIARSRPLPPEFQLLWHEPEPWRPADSLLVHRLMALEVAGAWRRELVRARLARRLSPADLDLLLPSEGPDDPPSLAAADPLDGGLLAGLEALRPPFPAGLGSNVFVLAGERTASGAPLLASDPHLPLRAPGTWYLAALRAPGLEVEGGTIPGLPAVVIGRTGSVAWGLTTTGADSEDLVRIRSDPADPGRYLVPGGSEPFGLREETIRVRFAEPERLVVRTTRFGPIVSDLVAGAAAAGSGELLALQWTGLDPTDRTLAAGFAMARAADADALLAALADFASPVQNVAFADRKGRIGLAVAGRVPIRRGHDGRLPAPGWDGTADWLGWIPAERLPRGLDPASGFLVNANNRVVGPDHPDLLTAEWDGPARARRLHELLEGRREVDSAAARTIQQDLVSAVARELLPVLVPLAREGVAKVGSTPAVHEALDALAAFDGTMDAERVEPLLLSAWILALGPKLRSDELGPLLADTGLRRPEVLRAVLLERQDRCGGPAGCARAAAAALETAVAALEARLGPDRRRWRWGEQHRAVMPHRPFGELPLLGPLLSPAPPVGGDATTLAVAAFRAEGPGGPFPAHHGAGLRLVVDLAEPGVRAVVATGQVGHPLSGHYADLTPIWAAGGDLRLDPDRIERGPARRQRLEPAPR